MTEPKKIRWMKAIFLGMFAAHLILGFCYAAKAYETWDLVPWTETDLTDDIDCGD